MSVVCAWVFVCEWSCFVDTADVAQALLREVWHKFMFHDHTAECSNGSDPTNHQEVRQAYKQFSLLAQRSQALVRPHVNYSISALGFFAGFVEAKRRARVFERYELNVKFVRHLEQLLNGRADGDVTHSSTTLMTLTRFRREIVEVARVLRQKTCSWKLPRSRPSMRCFGQGAVVQKSTNRCDHFQRFGCPNILCSALIFI